MPRQLTTLPSHVPSLRSEVRPLGDNGFPLSRSVWPWRARSPRSRPVFKFVYDFRLVPRHAVGLVLGKFWKMQCFRSRPKSNQSINHRWQKRREWRSDRETERTERENGEGRDHYDVLGGPRRYREEDRALVRGARRPVFLLHRQGELCFHFVSVVVLVLGL